MIAVVSPAKSLDFEKQVDFDSTSPLFQKEAIKLVEELKDKSENEVQNLMSISEKLASLNVERYHNFTKKEDPKHAKQALFAFQGDVYQGLDAESLDKKGVKYAQDHLRILSGLYGVLRPLDLIQPYRLEMGTKLNVNGYDNLYEFWGEKIAKQLNKDIGKIKTLVNLASKEYFKSVDKKILDADVLDIRFEDFKNGKYKIISFYAKKARGLMFRYMIDNQCTKSADLKGFDYDGYEYTEAESSDNQLVFRRG